MCYQEPALRKDTGVMVALSQGPGTNVFAMAQHQRTDKAEDWTMGCKRAHRWISEMGRRRVRPGAHLWMETSTTTSGHSVANSSRSRSVAVSALPCSRSLTAARIVDQDGCGTWIARVSASCRLGQFGGCALALQACATFLHTYIRVPVTCSQSTSVAMPIPSLRSSPQTCKYAVASYGEV